MIRGRKKRRRAGGQGERTGKERGGRQARLAKRAREGGEEGD